jgi:hypothetical protein
MERAATFQDPETGGMASAAPFPYPSLCSPPEFLIPPGTGNDPSPVPPGRDLLHGVGRRLRGLRERLGVSQETLAALAGVSQSAVSRLETGRSPGAPFMVVLRLGVALGRFAGPMRTRLPREEQCLLDAFDDLADTWPTR